MLYKMCGPQCVSMCAGVGVAVSVRLFLMFNCYRICDHGWSTDFLFHFRRLTDNNLHEHKRTEQTRWHVNTFPHRNTHTHTQAHVLNTHTHIHAGNVVTKFLCVCITFYLILFYSGNPFENCWQIHNNCLLLYARGCVCDVMSLCVGVFGNLLCQSCCCYFCCGVSAIFK